MPAAVCGVGGVAWVRQVFGTNKFERAHDPGKQGSLVSQDWGMQSYEDQRQGR